jgi:hypothetical protein
VPENGAKPERDRGDRGSRAPKHDASQSGSCTRDQRQYSHKLISGW